jgi:hypothetical protein
MTYAAVLKFNKLHDKLGRFAVSSAPEGGGGAGTSTPSKAYAAYVAKYPKYQPEVDAFVAKYPRKAQMDLEIRGVPDGIPSYEFQIEVEQKAHKRLQKEHRDAKAAGRAENKPRILEQLKAKYGLSVDDQVFDRETGAKGVVRWGKDGQPYVETGMGKHLVGVRWQKLDKG